MKGIHILLAFCVFVLFSCTSNTSDKVEKVSDSNESEGLTELASKVQWKYDMLLVNHINAPVKLLSENEFDKDKYDEGLTNPLSNSDKYNSNDIKAINLGVYGSDLAYISTYGQTQDIIDYFIGIKKIAEDLAIPVFTAEAMQQFEDAKSEEGKMIDLIYNKYEEMDKFLVENERFEVLTLITAGGYIEGMHLALSLIKTEDFKDEAKFVMEQKATLANLQSILSDFEGSNAYISNINSSFNTLSEAFKGVDYDKAMDADNIGALEAAVSSLREKLIADTLS